MLCDFPTISLYDFTPKSSSVLVNMVILDRFKASRRSPASSTADLEKKPQVLDIGMRQIFRPRIIAMAVIVSMGGFIFGMSNELLGFLHV